VLRGQGLQGLLDQRRRRLSSAANILGVHMALELRPVHVSHDAHGAPEPVSPA
jgi:hypothetical protein